MGLYEKAKQYMYERKLEVLNNLEKRQFRNVFEEDEHLISIIIKECSYLLKKDEGNEVCMNRLLSSFVFNNAVDLSSKDFIEGFISLLKKEIGIDTFLFYDNQDKRYILDEVSKKTWTYGDIKEIFKPSDFDFEGKIENLDAKNLNIVKFDFLSLIKECAGNNTSDDNDPVVTLTTSNVEAFCVLDENLKPFVFFVFASPTIDFPKEDIADSLQMATFIFYYFYVSKIRSEYEVGRNSFSFVLKTIETLLDKNSSIYVNTFKLKHLVTPKKFKGNHSELYAAMDAMLAETKEIENIFCLGNYHYVTITDNEMLSKQHLDSFKSIMDRLKRDVCPGISFHISRVDYPSKRFTSKDEFMAYIMLLLDRGCTPVDKISKKTAVASAKKDNSKSKGSTKSTTHKKRAADKNVQTSDTTQTSAAKKSTAKKK